MLSEIIIPLFHIFGPCVLAVLGTIHEFKSNGKLNRFGVFAVLILIALALSSTYTTYQDHKKNIRLQDEKIALENERKKVLLRQKKSEKFMKPS